MQINVLITRSTNFVGAEESTNGFLNGLREPRNNDNVNIPVYKNIIVNNGQVLLEHPKIHLWILDSGSKYLHWYK